MEKAKVRTSLLVMDGVGTDVVSGMAVGIGLFGALCIGAWGLACFIGGIVQAGGIIGLAKGWLSAVTGV
jgi:hypothetical protein